MRVQPVKVLVADDSPAFVGALCGMLDRMGGLEVVARAGEGGQALAEFARHHPALVIMDISMPGMGGLEAALHMRQASPRTRIVLVSVHQGAQIEAESARNGADCFLPKIGLQRQLQTTIEHLFPDLVPERGKGGAP